ncbi:hypothetical protein ONZ51_g8961 [Trametes cubensis]|uniref:C2H2-type domain-containing protein n=1 Tax=Trametes cubensis TaxID=1111947 RepID=A0AAD7X7Q9_9APHY|nr:hypothetical protein ONZ51_g8961 [Trametes cubensis]
MSSIHSESLDAQVDWFMANSNNSPATTLNNDVELEEFDNYVDDASPSFPEGFAFSTAWFDPNYDWSSAFQQPHPCPHPSSACSTSNLTLDARSPSLTASDITLVDSPTPSTPSDSDFGISVGVIVLQPPAHFCSQDHQFVFEPGQLSVSIPPYVDSASPIETDAHASLSPWGTTTCYGQPQQQHPSLGAVAAFACDGVRMQADPSPLTSQALETPALSSPALPSRKRSSKAAKASADIDNESLVKDKKPAKRRRKQDTTKSIPCPECGSMWARRNNLDIHIRSVHRGERPFACSDCPRVFGRKHDLRRHFQSEHTTLGSPRRKDVK